MAGLSWRLRRAAGDADRRAYVDLVNALQPEWPTSEEEQAWQDATYPGGARILAEDAAGRLVGAAATGRIFSHGPEFERLWLWLGVVPEARRHGLGTALLEAASAVAATAGKTGFQGDVLATWTDGLAFLERHGFVVYETMRLVRLGLEGIRPPAVEPPPGIRITDLAREPGRLAGVHAVAVATFPDIPHVGDPVYAGTLDEFRERDVDRPGIPREAFMVAVDEATDEVAGYASLLYAPGSTTTAYHDMTAVRPGWRGRGVATALKRATIAWAATHGVAWLETGNDASNAPMRQVNAKLGFQPMPDLLGVRGPLALRDGMPADRAAP